MAVAAHLSHTLSESLSETRRGEIDGERPRPRHSPKIDHGSGKKKKEGGGGLRPHENRSPCVPEHLTGPTRHCVLPGTDGPERCVAMKVLLCNGKGRKFL